MEKKINFNWRLSKDWLLIYMKFSHKFATNHFRSKALVVTISFDPTVDTLFIRSLENLVAS